MILRRVEVWKHDTTIWVALSQGDPCSECCDETDAEYDNENMNNSGCKKLELGNSRSLDVEFY